MSSRLHPFLLEFAQVHFERKLYSWFELLKTLTRFVLMVFTYFYINKLIHNDPISFR